MKEFKVKYFVSGLNPLACVPASDWNGPRAAEGVATPKNFRASLFRIVENRFRSSLPLPGILKAAVGTVSAPLAS